MEDSKNSRRSERPSKGIPPERYGFRQYESENGARGGIEKIQKENGSLGRKSIIKSVISKENTLTKTPKASNPESIISRNYSKQSQRSIREIEYLKKKMEREAEIHKLEMQELEKKKAHLLKIQKDEDNIKQYEDELSNNDGEEDEETEFNNVNIQQRKNDIKEWVDQIPVHTTQMRISRSLNNMNALSHPEPFQTRSEINFNCVEEQSIRTNDTRRIRNTTQAMNNNAHPRINRMDREPIIENRQVTNGDMQNDVLIAALKALQSRDIKDLPIFNGDSVLEWPNFISEFKRSTEEFNINANKNLRRLNKALEENARSSVRTLLTSPENIDEIISQLEMSFGRPEWILQHLICDLRSLPSMKEENIHQFKIFYNKLFGAITTIRNMKAGQYLENPELLACLEDKLPPTTRNFWIRYKADLYRKRMKIDLTVLGEWFKYELDAQFAGLSVKDVVKKSNKATVMAINTLKTTKEKWCYKCNGAVGHYLRECNDFKKMNVDKRREFVKKNNICFMCLIKGHQTRICRKRDSLPKCTKCNKGHADILHYETNDTVNAVPIEEVRCINTCDVLLKIAIVTLKGLKATKTIFAFFDEGSTATIIDADLANELGLEGTLSPITYRWTNDIVRTDSESRIVKVDASAKHENAKFYPLMNVRTAKNLSLPNQKFDVEEIMNLHPYLCRHKLEAIKDAQPLLLIGSNNAGLTVSLKTIQFKIGGLLECKSRLGWTVHGPVYEKSMKSQTTLSIHLCVESENNMNLNDLIKESYKIENFGVNAQIEKLSEADIAAMNIMKNTLRNVGDRYEIGQLYKNPEKEFPTIESKRLATQRLYYIERKMDRDPNFAKAYTDKIETHVKKGYAEKLIGDQLKETSKTYYLPHFDAYDVNKPGKFRWVMDAKTKAGNNSLNDLLLQGPDFVPPLLAVLWRARMKPIGFSSDIKEMFHQVLIRPEDRDSQRFLFRGMDRKKTPDVYRMKAMVFGAVSSPTMAQFVKNENAKLLQKEFPGIERAIVKQHYVDDYLDCSNTVEEAANLASNVMTVHQKGGFELVKWISNSKEFMQQIPEDMRLSNYDKVDVVRVLGLLWDINKDEIIFTMDFKKFDTKFKNGEIIPTKRQMLKFIMSIFDPIGFLSPLVIKLKILFQELWRLDSKWDSEIPDGIFEKWISWLKQAKTIHEVRIPRCYFPFITEYDKVQLHTFSDAGDKAYNAMTFIRIELGDQAYLSLVQAKARVAPIKPSTIPRLELQGGVTGSQMSKTIETELGVTIDKKYFWVDSTIVLSWINTKEKLGAYVASRILKLLECSKKEEWFWIPTHLNTADLATKSSNKVDFAQESTWFNGPEFLKLPEAQWPKFNPPTISETEFILFLEELESAEEVVTNISLIEGHLLPDSKRFSKYNRLIRATAYVLKIVQNLKLANKDKPRELVIDLHDLEKAKKLWYKKVQFDCYAQELQDIHKRGYVKKTSCLYLLSPFINKEGIICMKGRIPGMNPIILHRKHRFTNLLISWYHEQNLHQGVDTVINHLQETFRIPACRAAVKQAFKSCMMCRVRKPKVRLVEMGNIPKERSERCDYPFTYTAIDYFGPIMVRYGKRYEKVWGALFTCLTMRGIHVELVSSLTTTSAIMALTRFMNIRGVPKKMFSDNATCFTATKKELQDFINNLDHEKIRSKLAFKGIEWMFNCPAAPHRNGVCERMIQSVKEGLEVLIDTEFPNYEVLSTAISEVVNTVNNRPLTYVSNDANDLKPITPNDIILLRANHSQYDVEMDYNFKPRETWKMAHKIADQFWYRWMKEYRPLLVKRTKWPDNRDDPKLKVGDLVIIVDENEIRGRFPKAIITKVFPDKEGIVRTVKIKTTYGTILTRPITKIAKIDISEGLENVNENN